MFYFGVDYYPEHWPEERWLTDAQLMDEAGFNVVHLAEFAWSMMEPEDGGETWTANSVGLTEEEEFMDFFAPTAATRWFDADNGLIVASLVGEAGSKVLALRTNDGGQSWKREAVPAQFGALFLTRDGELLTITHLGSKISVLRYQETEL